MAINRYLATLSQVKFLPVKLGYLQGVVIGPLFAQDGIQNQGGMVRKIKNTRLKLFTIFSCSLRGFKYSIPMANTLSPLILNLYSLSRPKVPPN